MKRGMNLKKKHIIFDMDGTLSDTARATLAAIQAVEKKYDLPTITIDNIRSAMGLAGMEFFGHIYPEVPAEKLAPAGDEIDALESEKIAEIGEKILFSGVAEMLESLKKDGYILYIASTGSEHHVEVTLQSSGIKKYFTGISCGKPEKISMVREIINDRNPSEFLMVGDMFKDSEAARGNNIRALGAAFGYLAKDDYGLFDAIIDKPMDVYDYLQ